MVDSNLFLGVHSLDLADILQDLGMMDLSLEDEKLCHNMIDHEIQQRIHLPFRAASDVGVKIAIRQREHVKRSRR